MYACSIESNDSGSSFGRAALSEETRYKMRVLNHQRAAGEITVDEYIESAHRSVSTPLVYAEATDPKTTAGAARAAQTEAIRRSLREEFGMGDYQDEVRLAFDAEESEPEVIKRGFVDVSRGIMQRSTGLHSSLLSGLDEDADWEQKVVYDRPQGVVTEELKCFAAEDERPVAMRAAAVVTDLQAVQQQIIRDRCTDAAARRLERDRCIAAGSGLESEGFISGWLVIAALAMDQGISKSSSLLKIPLPPTVVIGVADEPIMLWEDEASHKLNRRTLEGLGPFTRKLLQRPGLPVAVVKRDKGRSPGSESCIATTNEQVRLHCKDCNGMVMAQQYLEGDLRGNVMIQRLFWQRLKAPSCWVITSLMARSEDTAESLTTPEECHGCRVECRAGKSCSKMAVVVEDLVKWLEVCDKPLMLDAIVADFIEQPKGRPRLVQIKAIKLAAKSGRAPR